MKNISITLLLALGAILFNSGGCGNPKAFVEYKPPILPMYVSIDSNGEISLSFSQAVTFPTFLGDFSVGVSWDPIKDFNAPNILIIRIDDKRDYIYDLRGQDFSISFESGYYEKVKVSKTELTPANSENPETVLLLEVKRKDTEVYSPKHVAPTSRYVEPTAEVQVNTVGVSPLPVTHISRYSCESNFSGGMFLRFNWTYTSDTSNVLTYEILLNRQDGSGDFTKVSSKYGSSVDNDSMGGTTYYNDVYVPCYEGTYQWMVRAKYDSEQYSEWSSPVNFTVSK